MIADSNSSEHSANESQIKSGAEQFKAGADKAGEGLNSIKRGLQSVASEAVRGAKQTLSDHADDAKKVAQNAGSALSEQTKARPLVLLGLTFLAGFALAEATRRR